MKKIKNKMKVNSVLPFLYAIALLCCYPIGRYIFLFVLFPSSSHVDRLAYERVYLSGPLLILIGAIMAMSFRKVNRLIGFIISICGIIWLTLIMKNAIEGV
jgi:hypothetical protein